jgi:mannitol-1-phosphate/altronate dehydrogenase
VVHIGLGAFHRSHQAVYFDDLAHVGRPEWGIVGTSLRRRDAVADLKRQDGLYTVTERDGSVDRVRVIGAHVGAMFGPDDPAALVRRLSDRRTRLVTLTITGDGYLPSSQSEHSAQSGRSGLGAGGTWDLLVAALALRRSAGTKPFTVLSCDNIPRNGEAARQATLRRAHATDQVLARWIQRSVSFPDSMVDRITPGGVSTGQNCLSGNAVPRDDACAVIAEPFSQWVIGEDFCNDRPPLDQVGVQFVSDVQPYGLMKNRLLNAGHSAVGYLASLEGYSWTDQAMRDSMIRRYFERLMAQEIVPLLPPIPGIDLAEYQRTLLTRFSNPAIRDSLSRLCRRGSTKMPAYLLPSLHAAVRRGSQRQLLTVAVAGWFWYLRGTDLRGNPIRVVDPDAGRLQRLARIGGTDPRPLLGCRDIFGDLVEDESFVAVLTRCLEILDDTGVHGLLSDEALISASCAA